MESIVDAGQISSQFLSLINQEDVHDPKAEIFWLFLLYCIKVKEDFLFVSDYMVLIDCCIRILYNEGDGLELRGVVRDVLSAVVQLPMYSEQVCVYHLK